MKAMLLCLMLVLTGSVLKAQDANQTEIPLKISQDFTQKFPDLEVREIEWRRNDFVYKAEFENEGNRYEITYDKSGSWVSTKLKSLGTDDLPEKLQSNFNEGTEGLTLDDIDDIEKRENKEGVLYKLEVETANGGFDYYFDEDGNYINNH